MKHHLPQKQNVCSRLTTMEKSANILLSRSLLLLLFLFATMAGTAQDVLGTDGEDPQANHASATLPKKSGGYINEESIGGCYLFCFTGKNDFNKSTYTFTQPSATLQPT